MSIELEISKIAEQFLTGLRTRNAEMLRALMHADAVWSLPGTSLITYTETPFPLRIAR